MNNPFKSLLLIFTKKASPQKETPKPLVSTELIKTTDSILKVEIVDYKEVEPYNNPLAYRPIITKHDLN